MIRRSMTHTYVTLGISEAAFEEIKQKLLAAGYSHVLSSDGTEIDMSGIGLVREEE